MKLLIPIVLVAGVAAFASTVDAAITVRNAAELQTAVERLSAGGGTIVLARGRYSSVVVGPRRARLLTIVARPGASTGRVSLTRTAAVRIVGLRLSSRTRRARLFVTQSRNVRFEDLTVAGGRHGANASVLDSAGVVIDRSDFTRCGEGKTPDGGYCLRLIRNHGVRVDSSRFRDCYGCDFIHGTKNVFLSIRRSVFDRALVGRCGRSVARCHHQDLVHLADGRGFLIDSNRFGVQEWPGAAQVYLNGDIRRVRIANNVFVGTDPKVPGYQSQTALWIGNRRATDVPRQVIVVNNTILTGRERLLRHDRNPTATSVVVSPLYAGIARVDRPVLVNNVIGLLETPWRLCPYVRAARANVVAKGTACSRKDVVAAPALAPDARPTAASSALIDRADPTKATRLDHDGRPRGAAPDIGAFEYTGG